MERKRNNSAVLDLVTAGHQERTVGIVYVLDGHWLYTGAGRDQWKTKQIADHGDVSMTVPIAKRAPLMPWVENLAATNTFSGTVRLLEKHQLGEALFKKLYRHMSNAVDGALSM